jgi:uncharacterized protein (UPF0261 family)
MSKKIKAKTIAPIGTLDTKGDDIKYLKNQIEGQGFNTITIDVGVLAIHLLMPMSREKLQKPEGYP